MVLSRFKNLLLEAGDRHCENWFAMTTAMQPARDQGRLTEVSFSPK